MSVEQVIMDLGDFVAEEYVRTFRLNGHAYEVRYPEARVDEMLAILKEAESDQDIQLQAASRRRYVADLFSKNLTAGDPAQLIEDLGTLPYVTLRGSLDIYTLYMHAQGRVKKKSEPGDLQGKKLARFGFLGRLLFSSKRVKAD